MKAYCLIRQAPWYRREIFETGLKRAGHQVFAKPPERPDRDTLLIIWNRYSSNHDLALQVERAGGTVIVAENGYIGAGGTSPKFDVHPEGPKPHHYYAVSLDFHNGRGRNFYPPDRRAERFEKLGIELKPWRERGDYVLVCPNRSFGVGAQVMHPDWAERVAERVRKAGLPVKVRTHPGNNAPKVPLAADLAGAMAVFVWSSSSALHALVEGIPTFIEAPWQIVKRASASGPIGDRSKWILPERREHFEIMAWAQWQASEIETGEPFRLLLPPAGQG